MYEANAGGKETPGLEDYLAAVRARKWLVLACTLIGFALALLYTQTRTPTYEAEAKVLLGPTPVGAVDNRLAIPNLEDERVKMASFAIADGVIDELNLPADTDQGELLSSLSVSFRPETNVLVARYESTDAEEAREVINSFVDQYAAARNAEDLDWYDGQIASFDEERAPLLQSLRVLDTEIAQLEEELAAVRNTTVAANPDRNDEIEEYIDALSPLRVERAAFISDMNPIARQVAEIQRERDTKLAAATVQAAATTPDTPVGFSDAMIWAAGLLLGFIVGLVSAFVLDRLDTSARDDADIELASGAPVLGTIPRFGFGNRSGAAAVVMLSSGKSANLQRSREAFRRLRTSVQYLSASGGMRSLLITSAQPAEGKSVTCANLAVALAQGGTTVVLVSADLRRPTVENLFSVPNETGLADALQGANPSDVPLISVGVDNLAVVPAGPSPAHPGELLGSTQFQTLVERLEGLYDIVLIDTPPVLAAADAAAASAAVDGVLVCVDTDRTDTQTMLQVRADLDRAGGNVVGVVTNRDRDRPGTFRRRYDYSYEKTAAGV